MGKGIVYFVGAGPGHAKLITLKGLELLQKADAIVYDRLANPNLLQHAKQGTKKIYVGKRPDRHSMKQEEINELLVELASQYSKVVRLKGGDPSVFGRVGEEAEQLVKHSIPFEIVPGISSATAVPIYAGIPVTHREFNSSFIVVTGHEKPEKLDSTIRWDKLAEASETLIFLMGVAKIRYISEQLMKYGKRRETPVALVRWGTTAKQETLKGTLETIASLVESENFQPPAVIVVGEVVSMRDKIAWVESLPLFGTRVLVSTANTNSSRLAEMVEDLGGEAILFPTVITDMLKVQEKPLHNEQPSYDAVLFDQTQAVRYFLQWLKENQIDVRALASMKIIAMGTSVAKALNEHGLIADRVIEEQAIDHLDMKRVLYPTSDIVNDALELQMKRLGIEMSPLPLYTKAWSHDHVAHIVNMCQRKEIDVLAFTSAKAVINSTDALKSCGFDPEHLRQLSVACIGEKTAEEARNQGYRVSIVAEQPSLQALTEAIVQYRREIV